MKRQAAGSTGLLLALAALAFAENLPPLMEQPTMGLPPGGKQPIMSSDSAYTEALVKQSVFRPSLYSPREISARFAKEAAATKSMAYSFICLLVVISGYRFVMKASAGEQVDGLPSLWGLLLVVGTLVGYSDLFKWVFDLGFLVENAFSRDGPDGIFSKAMGEGGFAEVAKDKTQIISLSIPMLISGLVSFLTYLVYATLVIARYVFATILFIVGPFFVVAALHPTGKKMANGWMLGVIQLALWMPFVNIVSAVCQSSIFKSSLEGGAAIAPVTVVGSAAIGLLSIVVMLLAPVIIAKAVDGDVLGGLAMAASLTTGLIVSAAAGPAGLAAAKLATATGAAGMLRKVGLMAPAAVGAGGGGTGTGGSSRWGVFAAQSATFLQAGLKGVASRLTPARLRNAVNPGAALQRSRVKQNIAELQRAMKAETQAGTRNGGT